MSGGRRGDILVLIDCKIFSAQTGTEMLSIGKNITTI